MRSVEQLETVGRAFDVPLQANPLAGGVSPIPRPEEYFTLGFKVVVYGIDRLMQATRTMQAALADIRSGRFELQGRGATFKEYVTAVGFDDWERIEGRYGGERSDRGTRLPPKIFDFCF